MTISLRTFYSAFAIEVIVGSLIHNIAIYSGIDILICGTALTAILTSLKWSWLLDYIDTGTGLKDRQTQPFEVQENKF